MHLKESLIRLINRFRYPVSLPEEIMRDLGLFLPLSLDFEHFLEHLLSPPHPPTKLRKQMPRHRAEAVFESAFKKEKFLSCSLFSYYFNQGWLVFTLYFDANDHLRRIYLQCPAGAPFEGGDLFLDEEPSSMLSTLSG
jgi:hypothetical protein